MKYPFRLGSIFLGFLLLTPLAFAEVRWSNTTNAALDWTDVNNWVDEEAPLADESRFINLNPSTNWLNSPTLTLDRTLQIARDGFWIDRRSGTLTFDLNENTFWIQGGEFRLARSDFTTNVDFTNGTMRLGELGDTPSTVSLNWYPAASGSNSSGTTRFLAGSTLNFENVSSLGISVATTNRTTVSTIDLSEATLQSGAVANAMIIRGNTDIARRNATATAGTQNSNSDLLLPSTLTLLRSEGHFVIGMNTNTTTNSSNVVEAVGTIDFGHDSPGGTVDFEVTGNFWAGRGANSEASFLNLPSNFNLTIGTSEDRGGSLHFGHKHINQNASEDRDAVASLVAPGGTLNAWLTEARIGDNTRPEGAAIGTLDYSAGTLGTLDISGAARIGLGHDAEGALLLRGGNALSDSLLIGDSSSTEGLLSLDETIWTTSLVTIGESGRIDVFVRENNAGLDISSSSAGDFTVDSGGLIDIAFDAFEGLRWGLRMSGDQQVLFDDLITSGAITTSGAYGSFAEVTFDGDFTYISVIPEPAFASLLLALVGVVLAPWIKRRLHRIDP